MSVTIRRSSIRALICAGIVAVSAAIVCSPAAAQEIKVSSLLDDYKNGKSTRALEVAGRPCPDQDPARLRLLRELLALDQDDARVRQFAEHLGYALQKCSTPELHEWFRTSLALTADPFTILALGTGLARSTTPDNSRAVQELLYRADVLPEIRSQVLLFTSLSPLERTRLLIAGVAHGRNIPAALLDIQFRIVLSESDRHAIRQEMLAAVEQAPNSAQADDVLAMLMSELEYAKDAAWRNTLAAGMRRLAHHANASAAVRARASHTMTAAQEQPPAPADAVAEFARVIEAGKQPWSTPGASWVPRILMSSRDYPDLLVLSVIEELESVVLHHPVQRVRIAATTWLTTPGDLNTPAAQRRPDMVGRMGSLYRASTDRGVRATIVDKLANQADTSRAIALIEVIAAETTDLDPQAELPMSVHALNARNYIRCRSAAEVAKSEGPARLRALGELARCGPQGGVLLAAELRKLKSVSDSAQLIGSFHGISRILDANVLEAALDVASDRQATLESRIVAFKLLISYVRPRFVTRPISSFLPGKPPSLGTVDHFTRFDGAALPPNWLADARALLMRLGEDPLESDTMRFAARRALIFLREP